MEESFELYHGKRVGTEAKRISLEMKHNYSLSLPALGHGSTKMIPPTSSGTSQLQTPGPIAQILAPSSPLWPGTLHD